MPVDWKQSRTRSLHVPTFNLQDEPVRDSAPPTLASCPTFLTTPPHPLFFFFTNLSHKSQTFIVPALSAVIKIPPPFCPPGRERVRSQPSCRMTRSWGSSWTCTPSLSPVWPRSLFSQQNRYVGHRVYPVKNKKQRYNFLFVCVCVQVIEEIEEMMQDSPDFESQQNPSQSDLSMLSMDVQRFSTNTGCKDSECGSGDGKKKQEKPVINVKTLCFMTKNM